MLHPKAWIVAGLAAVAMGGIAISADAQQETFLHSSDLGQGFSDIDIVSGNVVALTGLLVAAAITVAGALMATIPWRRRATPLLVLFLASFTLVLVVQTAMFNYVAEDLTLSAVFSISPIFLNLAAAPSIFLGPLALVMGAGFAMLASCRTLLAAKPRNKDLASSVHASWGAMLLVAPFLVVAVAGDILVLVKLPTGDPSVLPYLVLLPLVALASVTLLVAGAIKCHQVAQAANEIRLAPVAAESWSAMRRVEWAAVATILGAAVLGTFLPRIPMDLLEAGQVFGLTTRSYMQSHLAILLMLAPWWTLHMQVLARLDAPTPCEEIPEHTSILFLVVLAAAALAAMLLTFLAPGAMWAWLGAAALCAMFALTAVSRRESLLPAMLCALVLWAIGNTVVGTIALATDFTVSFETSAGVLALARALSMLVVAWAIARSARPHAQHMPNRLAWPLTLGLGAAVALVIFLELPYSAWIQRSGEAQAVAIGTVVASQEPAVRFVMHGLSVAAASAAGLAIARLHRPDWFQKGAAPQSVSTPLPDLPEHRPQ